MRVSTSLTILLLAFLSRSFAPAEDQDKPDTVPPAEAEPEDFDDGKAVQLALEAGMHTARATRLLFSPDGKQAVTVSLDKTIRIWDLATGQTIRVLRPPSTTYSGQILDAALSPDGQLLAIQCNTPRGKLMGKDVQGILYLIRLSDGQILQTWSGAYRRQWAALAFSPDGKRLAASEGGSGKSAVRILDIASGKPEKELDAQAKPWPAAKLYSVAFSPDGQELAGGAAGEHGLRVWSLATGQLLHKVAFANKDQYVPAVAWSPDGKLLAYCSSHAPVHVLQRDGETFQELWQAKPGAVSRFLAFTPDGRQLFHSGQPTGASGRPVFLRDALTGKSAPEGKGKERPLLTVPVEEHKLETGTLSAEGRLLGFTGNNPQEVFVYKADGTLLHRLAGKAHPIARATWALDGQSIAWTEKKPAKGANPVFRRSFNLAKLEFDPELPDKFQEPVLTRGDLSLRQEGIRTTLLKGEEKVAEFPGITSLTLLANDYAAVVGGVDPIGLFKTTTGKRVRGLAAHTAGVTSLAPSPDGRYLLSSGNDQVMHIWSPEQDKTLKNQRMLPLLSLFFAGEEWVAWTQEGYYAASPAGEKLIGWVTDSGPGKLMKFHPAQRFRAKLYKPEVIKLVPEKGSVEEARKAAKVEKQDIEKLLPPQASLKPVQDGAKVTVEAVVQVSDKTQPLTELHLLVDGRPAQLGNGQVAVKTFAPAAKKDVKESWTVTLEPGLHKLSVRAMAKDTYSISEEVSLEEVKPPVTAPRNNKQGTLYYLGIGVNQFKYEPDLKLAGAVPDIVAMEKCLKENCKNRFVEIKPTVLTDDKATFPAILEALTKLPGKLKPADVVIVHYSSHGEVEEGGGLFLLCHDTKRSDMKSTAVPGEKLREILGQYPCPVLLILDACHAGKFPLMRPATDPLSRLLADDSCGVAVLTAALAHHKVFDTGRGGVFTQALIEGLSGKADPDKISKRLYVHHLFTYVFDVCARETFNKQMPLYLPSGSVPPIVLKE